MRSQCYGEYIVDGILIYLSKESLLAQPLESHHAGNSGDADEADSNNVNQGL